MPRFRAQAATQYPAPRGGSPSRTLKAPWNREARHPRLRRLRNRRIAPAPRADDGSRSRRGHVPPGTEMGWLPSTVKSLGPDMQRSLRARRGRVGPECYPTVRERRLWRRQHCHPMHRTGFHPGHFGNLETVEASTGSEGESAVPLRSICRTTTGYPPGPDTGRFVPVSQAPVVIMPFSLVATFRIPSCLALRSRGPIIPGGTSLPSASRTTPWCRSQ